MARFRGTVKGSKSNSTEATRLGHSYIMSTANGWNGGVDVFLYDHDGADWARVRLTRGSGHEGHEVVIYEGPVDAATRAQVATLKTIGTRLSELETA